MAVKRLILIHGRDFKPNKSDLKALWMQALRHGIRRDHPALLQSFDSVEKHFVYYGKQSEACLHGEGRSYDKAQDLNNRRLCLKALKTWQREDFLGPKGASNYRSLHGRSGTAQRLADLLASPMKTMRLDEFAITKVAPDMRYYWNWDSAYGSNLRWSLTGPLGEALERKEDVMLISHSLGTMIAFDVLWKFSYYGEYQGLRSKGAKVSHWLTLGSPLGNETVKQRFKGANATGDRRYPTMIRKWTNMAAKDDFISHDEDLANDYRKMVGSHLSEPIRDLEVYNLAVRGSKSNPHHGAGYLVLPQVADAVADWLSG